MINIKKGDLKVLSYFGEEVDFDVIKLNFQKNKFTAEAHDGYDFIKSPLGDIDIVLSAECLERVFKDMLTDDMKKSIALEYDLELADRDAKVWADEQYALDMIHRAEKQKEIAQKMLEEASEELHKQKILTNRLKAREYQLYHGENNPELEKKVTENLITLEDDSPTKTHKEVIEGRIGYK